MPDSFKAISFFFSFIIVLLNSTAVFSLSIGWDLSHTSKEEWERVQGNGDIEYKDPSVRFQIPSSTSTQWRLVIEPVWIYRFSELHLQYRAAHIRSASGLPLLRLDAGVIPALPDFSQPIPDWSDNDDWSMDTSAILADGQIHSLTLPIYQQLKQRQIDEINLYLAGTKEDAYFEILDLSFQNPDPDGQPMEFDYDPRIDPIEAAFQFHPIPLDVSYPQNAMPLSPRPPQALTVERIPFQLQESRSAAVTSFYDRGSITVPIQTACSEVFLFMGCDLAGSDYSFQFIEREHIEQPERLIIERHYEDGSVDRSFPYHIRDEAYAVDTDLSVYKVRADADKTLQKIILYEWMSYGRILLAGVTTRLSPDPLHPLPPDHLPWIQTHPQWQPPQISPSLTVFENTAFTLENQHFRVELSSQDGLWLTHLSHQKNKVNLLTEPSRLFALLEGNTPIGNQDFTVTAYQAEKHRIHFRLSGGTTLPLQIALTLYMDANDQLETSLKMLHTGVLPLSLQLRFPLLENLRLSKEIQEDYYFFPRKRTAWGNQPVRLMGDYSGEFPLQWMDVYSQSSHHGVALHTFDDQLHLKRYLLLKDASSTRMAVEHGGKEPIQLSAGETFSPATAAIQIHAGDWHAPLKVYRRWHEESHSSRRQAAARSDAFKKIFLVRRDYPVGGSGLLYDPKTNEYDFSSLQKDAQKHLGACDLIEVSGWDYTQQHGRVGTYDHPEIAGWSSLRQQVMQAGEENVQTALSLSGYLMDIRVKTESMNLREWALLNPDGTSKSRTQTEWYMNPAHPDWQKYLSETALRVLDYSAAQALYLDQLGFAADSKIDHSGAFVFPFAHPLLGEHVLLTQIRSVLDWMEHPAALYTEQAPVDLSAPLLDGAGSLGMTGSRAYPSPTRINAFRYAFPSFKIFEKIQPGIYPKAVDPSLITLAFFHGHALWIKGKAPSWYSREARAVIRKAQSIFHRYPDVFSSPHITPMIPTLQPGLFANRFSHAGQEIITLYNATMHTLSGALISLSTQKDQVSDLWGMDRFAFHSEKERVTINGTLHPHQAGCLIIE